MIAYGTPCRKNNNLTKCETCGKVFCGKYHERSHNCPKGTIDSKEEYNQWLKDTNSEPWRIDTEASRYKHPGV